MALQEVTAAFLKRFQPSHRPLANAIRCQCRQYATDTSASPSQTDLQDLEGSDFASTPSSSSSSSSPAPSGSDPAAFDPLKRSRRFKNRLPPGRYQYRPPRYYRGPLHPHQPPKPSDPSSREYRPGPFSLTRLEQTYNDTLAPDIMTLSYQHYPPGYEAPKKADRLRSWVGDSPYFKNRPLRGPRGRDVLSLVRKPITFNNIPKLERVTVHAMVKEAMDDSANLHVAGMAIQAITNVRAESHIVKKSSSFGLRAGKYVSITCELMGEDMYHFLSKVIDVVMPKIKDYKGIKGSSGDSSGNIAFGFTREQVALFPEIEVNYDAYPSKMIPGCHVIVHTSAATDRDARLLLAGIGVPFYGKLIN